MSGPLLDHATILQNDDPHFKPRRMSNISAASDDFRQPESQIETWTQSRGLRMLVALTVGGLLVAVIALAWHAVSNAVNPSICDPKMTLQLRTAIQKLNHKSKPYNFVLEKDLCEHTGASSTGCLPS